MNARARSAGRAMNFYAGSCGGKAHVVRGQIMVQAQEGWFSTSTWAKIRGTCKFFGMYGSHMNFKFMQARHQWISNWRPAIPILRSGIVVQAQLRICNVRSSEFLKIVEFLKRFKTRALPLWKF